MRSEPRLHEEAHLDLGSGQPDAETLSVVVPKGLHRQQCIATDPAGAMLLAVLHCRLPAPAGSVRAFAVPLSKQRGARLHRLRFAVHVKGDRFA